METRLAIVAELPDIMSGMKKIGSREFQKQFSKLAETLKAGDVVQVTKRGKPFVQVTKLGRKRIPTPDFTKRLATDAHSIKQGEALLAHLDEAVS